MRGEREAAVKNDQYKMLPVTYMFNKINEQCYICI